MARTRTRVDDEEALIPRSDMEEFHATTRKKVQGRRSCCCSVKCWFAMFLLLVLASTALFYFIYPSIVHENINKFIGFACSASGFAPQTNVSITCLIMTSPLTMATRAVAVGNTWGKRCTVIHFFYHGNQNNGAMATLDNVHHVVDTSSLEPLVIALNASDVTSWYLEADDGTFVSHDKLQRLLAVRRSVWPVYVGDDVMTSDVGAFALNTAAVRMLVGGGAPRSRNILKSVRSALNVTEEDFEKGFTANNPLLITDADQVKTAAKACTFRNVTADQMYAFFAVGST